MVPFTSPTLLVFFLLDIFIVIPYPPTNIMNICEIDLFCSRPSLYFYSYIFILIIAPERNSLPYHLLLILFISFYKIQIKYFLWFPPQKELTISDFMPPLAHTSMWLYLLFFIKILYSQFFPSPSLNLIFMYLVSCVSGGCYIIGFQYMFVWWN